MMHCHVSKVNLVFFFLTFHQFKTHQTQKMTESVTAYSDYLFYQEIMNETEAKK